MSRSIPNRWKQRPQQGPPTAHTMNRYPQTMQPCREGRSRLMVSLEASQIEGGEQQGLVLSPCCLLFSLAMDLFEM